jgi:hypothetical protein
MCRSCRNISPTSRFAHLALPIHFQINVLNIKLIVSTLNYLVFLDQSAKE